MHKILNPNIFYEGEGGGGGTDGGGDGGDGGEGGSGSDSGEGGKTFTQADLDAKAGEARADGRRSAEKKLAEELGTTVAEAKALITAARAKDESEKSDAQKAIEKAVADSASAEERTRAADLRTHQADVRDALRDAGVDKSRVARVAAMLTDVEVGADEATITSKVGELKKEFPELFGGEAGGAPDSDPGGGPKAKPSSEDAVKKGEERFKGSAAPAQYPILQDSK